MNKHGEFGKLLEEFMIETGYKLEYIANQTNVSIASIDFYKNGDRTPKDDFVEKFIEVFKFDRNFAEKIKMAVYKDRAPEQLVKEMIKLEKW